MWTAGRTSPTNDSEHGARTAGTARTRSPRCVSIVNAGRRTRPDGQPNWLNVNAGIRHDETWQPKEWVTRKATS